MVVKNNFAQTFVNYTAGEDEDYTVPQDVKLESWGISDSNGRNIMVGWKRNGYRAPNDHGVINCQEPSTEYGKDLFASMFKGW